MARKPNFDFERRERTKEKAAKRAEKTKAKSEKAVSLGGTDFSRRGADTNTGERW